MKLLFSFCWAVLLSVTASAANTARLPSNVCLEGNPVSRGNLIVAKGQWSSGLSSGSRVYESTPSNGLKVVKWEYADTQNPSAWTVLDGQTGTSVTWTYDPNMTWVFFRPWLEWLRYDLAYDANLGSVSGEMPGQTDVRYDTPVELSACAATRTGYSFGGWSTNKTEGTVFAAGDKVDGHDLGVTEDKQKVTLFARWTPNEYTVRFDVNCDGGTCEPAGKTVTFGSTYGELPVPTRPGKGDRSPADSWRFDGWFTDGNVEITKDTRVAITETLTLRAHWTEKFKVEFLDAASFSYANLKTEYVLKGGEAVPPNQPSHDGYNFTGWTGYGTGSTVFGNVGQDRTYTANYSEWTYDILFHSCNGKGETDKETYTYVTPKPLKANHFEFPGYRFLGWDTNLAARTVVYGDTQSVQGLSKGATVSLYAVWDPVAYRIAFDGNGATGGEEMQPMTVPYGLVTNLPPNAFTFDGLGFRGWRDELNGKTYADRAAVSNLTTEAGATVTLKATWSEGYFVEFNGNGSDQGAMARRSYELGTDVTLPKNAFTKKGYAFSHWTNSLESAEKRYADGATVRNLAKATGETATLFAVWEPNRYYVRFDDNGADSGSMDVQEFTYDQEQKLSPIGYKKDLHEFDGWSEEAEGAKVYTDKDSVLNLTSEPNATNVLYACWKPTLSELSKAADCENLDLQPGMGGLGLEGVEYGSFVVSETAAHTGTKSCCGSKTNLIGMCAHLDGPGTLSFYAKVELGEGSALLSWVDEAGTKILGDISPEWKEFVFRYEAPSDIAWYWVNSDKDATVWVDTVTWTPDTYTLRFDAKGGEGAPADVKIPLGSYGKLPSKKPTRDGYVFTGWTCGGKTYQPRDDFEQTGESTDVIFTFTADWKKSEEPPVPPEPVVTNAVPVAIAGLFYDGKEKVGVAAGANYEIAGNVATNAGDYVALATVTNGVWEGGATGPTNIAWTIAKATYDMSGVTFASASYEHDGEEHSIAVTGVPDGVEVVYSGDPTNRTEVGTNTVTASFKVIDTVNYNEITKQLTAKLIITPKEEPPEPVVTNVVPVAVTGLVYDGTERVGVPSGANYTIVGNVATNAGDYVAVATVTNGVWEGGATGATNIAWTIAKGTKDVSGITFADETFEYDGEEHSIAVTGVPDGVEVVYSGDPTNRTAVGTNTVTASFNVLDELNYNAITTQMVATLAIVKAPPPEDPGLVWFEERTIETEGGSNLVVAVWGGTEDRDSSVQLQVVYNTASSADLELKKTKVDGIVQPSFKFPYTLKWKAGGQCARIVEIPVARNKSTEADEFLTLQLGSPKNVRISGTDGKTENGGICTVKILGKVAQSQWYARAVADDAMRGSVSGSKLCKKGTKVTFKASAKAGFAFAGWKTNDVLATTAASWSFKMPAQAVEAVGTFVPQGEDYLRLGDIVLPSQLKAKQSVTLPLPAPESISRATVKVTGLPSGLSYDTKGNAVVGKPTKTGVKTVTVTVSNLSGYKIVRKYQVAVVKTVTSGEPAKEVSASGPGQAVAVSVNDELWGKATGAGVYAAGAKVTLKATASTGYVFTGWETNGVGVASRKASWSFAMPTGTVAAAATFRPVAEDYLELGRDFLPAELAYKVSTNVPVPAAESLSQPTVTISGLPSGLKYDAARGIVAGKPTKTGKSTVTVTASNLSGFKIVRKYQVTVVKGTPKAGFAKLLSEAKPYFALTAVSADMLMGSASGTGVRQAGKKVTVKATAGAGHVFSEWRDEGGRVTQKASYSFAMPTNDVTLVAWFVTKAADAASVGVTVDGLGFGTDGGEWTSVETNAYRGVKVSWPVRASAASLPSVKVTGLPKGLAFKSGKIEGVPTVASTTGRPSTVKITVTTAGGAVKTYSIVLTVVNREPWARGTYVGEYVSGGVTNGTVTLTVATDGKISGKIVRKVSGKTKTTTLSASSVVSRAQDDGGVFYELMPSYKSGTTTVKIPFVLQLDPEGSGRGIAASEEFALCQEE